MQIAKYFATFGIKVDQKSLDRINTILKKLEGYAKKYHAKIDSLEDRTTNRKVQNLQRVSKFQNKKMDEHVYAHKRHLDRINKEEERAAKKRAQAVRRVESAVRYYTPTHTRGPIAPSSASHSGMMDAYNRHQAIMGAARSYTPTLRDQGRYRLESIRRENARLRQERLGASMAADYERRLYNNSLQGRLSNAAGRVSGAASRAGEAFRNTGRNAFMVTGIAGSLGYLMNTMTQRTMKNESSYVMVRNAIKSVGGTDDEAKKRYQELVGYSKNIGIDYLPIMGDYAKMVSSAVGVKGTTIQDMTDTFKAYSNVASAFNLTPAATNLFLRGVTQSLSKDQLMAEEYTGQILEHAPIAPAYQEAYKRMQADKGITVGDNVRNALRADMKAGNISTIELNKYILEVFKEKYAPLVEQNKSSLTWSVNNFTNALNDAFNPLLNPTASGRLKEAWNNLTKAAEVAAPALLELGVFIAENFSKIVAAISGLLGIDLESQRVDKANAAKMLGSGADVSALTPSSREMFLYSGLVGAVDDAVTGAGKFLGMNPYISPSKQKVNSYKFLRGKVRDRWRFDSDLDMGATSDEIDAWLDDKSRSGSVWKKEAERLVNPPSSSSDSATKSVIKDVKKYKMPYEFSQGSGQTVNINKVEITTRDANTLSTDLTKALMQFNGSEK